MTPQIGMLVTPVPGHLIPSLTLARALEKKGAKVTLFTLDIAHNFLKNQNIETIYIGQTELKKDSVLGMSQGIRKKSGLQSLLEAIKFHTKTIHATFQELPELCRSRGIELLIVDEVQLQGKSVAEQLGIPCVTISCAFHNIPDRNNIYSLTLFKSAPSKSLWERLKNKIQNSFFDFYVNKYLEVINQYRLEHKLELHHSYEDTLSDDLHLMPIAPEFDFKRKHQERRIFLGSFIDNERNHATQPLADIITFEDKKPLIYVSLGTLANAQLKKKMLETVQELAQRGEYNFLFSFGEWVAEGGRPVENSRHLIVVPKLDQLSVLKEAALMITHAGQNSVQECIYFGVPMIALPLKHDQPGIAKRVEYSGLGFMGDIKNISSDAIHTMIQRIFSDSEIQKNVQKFKTHSQNAGGVEKAAELCLRLL